MGPVLDHSCGFLLSAVTNIVELHFASEGSGRDGVHQVVAGLYRCSIHGGDDVATLESGLCRRATGFDVHDDYTVGSAQFLQGNRIGAQIFLEAYADGAAGYASLGNDLVVDVDSGSRRQREAHTFIAAAAGDDGGVDADHFAGQVNERAAGIARIDRGVRLQKLLELMPCSADVLAVFGADNPGSHGRLESKRAANGQHPIADLHAIGVAELRNGQLFIRFNFDHGEVGILIHAHNFSGVLLRAAAQLHLNLGGLLDHVIVGEDVAALVNDHAGAKAALGLRWTILAAVKETVEEVLHRVVLIKLLLRRSGALLGALALQHLRGGDIDDCRLYATHDAGKRSRGRNWIWHCETRRVSSSERRSEEHTS